MSVEARACWDDDEKAHTLAVHNHVMAGWEASAEDVEAFDRAMVDSEEYIAFADGEVAGSGVAAIVDSTPTAVIAIVTVLPEHRRCGAGTALYRLISDWGRERGLDVVQTRIREDDPESLAFARRRGFEEFSRNGRLVLDLKGLELPEVEAPAGIELTAWDGSVNRARGMFAVMREAMPDIPGNDDWVEPRFDHWHEHHLRGPGDRPEATFVALAGDRVVGYAKYRFSDSRPGVATHHMTGVARDWRGRGVAGTLKRAQLRWAVEAGYETAETDNEMRNTPIRKLNESLGYRTAPGLIYVRGPLSAATT